MAFPILAVKEGEIRSETGRGGSGGRMAGRYVPWGDRFCHLFQLGPDVFSGT